MTPNDGGPAFPRTTVLVEGAGGSTAGLTDPGMSLRDWFAGQALIKTLQGRGPDEAAERAYEVADAMLAARERKEDR